MMKTKLLLVAQLCVFLILQGCSTYLTKQSAFPLMYEKSPLVILIAPPINLSTAANAKEYYSTTITEPLAEYGYYVLPYEITSEILKANGAYDSELFVNLPLTTFRDYFDADAVLFTTINKWDMSYLVVASNMTVGITCTLKSTDAAEVLWSYSGELKVDLTDRNQGNVLAQVIATAINSAVADYVPYARKANFMTLSTIPFGKYHKMHNMDKNVQVRMLSN